MNYEELKEFIDHGMRMSHIYQPVMLLELLAHGGNMKDIEIAKALLAHDQSQIEYYTKITNSMVGKEQSPLSFDFATSGEDRKPTEAEPLTPHLQAKANS